MLIRLDGGASNGKLGNKGESLLQMKAEGFNVPSGFVLDSGAYDDFICFNKLEDTVCEAVKDLTKDNVRETSERIISAFDGAALPDTVIKEIRDNISEGRLYAVRSSGSKEDLDNLSFAGQYQTFLNTEPDDIAGKVIGCYKSMFSEIILSYLANCKIDLNDLKMSVVVQEMVDSDYSGICFTLNPATGNDKEMLIEVSEGLGENIVSGKTVPEQFRYNWFTGTLTGKGTGKFITDEQAVSYAKTFSGIQQMYGFPCDIEFAIRDGELYILQARSITSIRYSEIKDLWTTADFKDGGVSATVCTPYMWSLYEYIWEYSLRKFIVDSKILKDEELPGKLGEMYYGRPYWNLSAVKKTMSRIIGYKEREFDSEYGIVGDYEGDGFVTKTTPATLAKMGVIAIEQMKILKDRTENNERYKNELLDLYFGYKKALDEGRIDDIQSAFLRITKETYLRSETTYFWQIFLNTIHQSMYKDSLLKYVSESEYLTLLGGIDNISHLLPFYEMWDITRKIRSDESVLSYWTKTDALSITGELDSSENFMPSVKELIDKYGYHSDKELDITYPCYYEEPQTIISMIKDMILLEDAYSPVEDKERGNAGYNEMLAKIRDKVSAGKYKKIEQKVKNMRKMLWWREEFRDVSTRFYYMLRMYTMEYARFLEKNGVIGNWEDVWFLKVGDLWDYIDGKNDKSKLSEIIARNKYYYNAYRNYISENEIGSGFTAITSVPEDENTLKGLGANNGRITGVARVIEDFSQIDRLQEGDILVTRFTDTGWTPKFAILSGIVTEYGGILCHAAIVSREYGIPAIVCCKEAMSRISDGQTITIDGTTGIVRIDE